MDQHQPTAQHATGASRTQQPQRRKPLHTTLAARFCLHKVTAVSPRTSLNHTTAVSFCLSAVEKVDMSQFEMPRNQLKSLAIILAPEAKRWHTLRNS